MKKTWKQLFAVILCVCLMVGTGLPARAESDFNQEFDDWLFAEWKEGMESSYLNMHYAVKDYRSFGIEKPEVTLGHVTFEDYADSVTECEETLKELESFDYDSLNESQKADYDTYHFYLEKMLVLNKYPMLDEYFNPYNGILTNMATNYTEFIFYEKEDIDDYLTLLADYTRYIDECLDFTRVQSENGYFMLNSTLDEAEDEIDEFVAKGEDNPLIIIFNERVEAFDGLSANEIESYENLNKDIVLNQIIPKYTEVKDALESMRGTRSQNDGICGYEGGEEYYLALAQYKTSTNYSVDELYDMSTEALNTAVDYIDQVINDWYANDPNNVYIHEVPFSEPEEMLEHLRAHLDQFPEGPDVTYVASYLDPSIANPSVMAYYLMTPLDDITFNVIRINESSVSDDINNFYMTLSHEGYPGHLYQFTYYLNTNPNPIRSDISVMGYQEGWAMYVEGPMIHEAGINEYCATYLEVNEFYGYLYNVILDIGVNGYGWTAKDIYDFVSAENPGFTMGDAKYYHDYFASVPGTYLSYGFGQLMFLSLKDEAKGALADDFDILEFHKLLLDNGPRPFETVQRELEAFITEKGYKVPEAGTYGAYMIEAYGMPETAGQKIEKPEESSETSEESSQSAENTESSSGEQSSKPTESSEQTSASSNGSVLGWIIGCVVGALVLTGIIVLMVALSKKKKNQAYEAQMQQAYQQQQQMMNQQYQQPQQYQAPQSQYNAQQPYQQNAPYGQQPQQYQQQYQQPQQPQYQQPYPQGSQNVNPYSQGNQGYQNTQYQSYVNQQQTGQAPMVPPQENNYNDPNQQ